MNTNKITLNELKSYIKIEVNKILKEENISELETSSYADLMNNTEQFPWTTYLSQDKDKHSNPKHLGKKQGRVNTLAKERFKTEFYKEFPKDSVSTSILTNKGKYDFAGVKFSTNYTYYELIFTQKDKHTSSILIKPERNGYYIDHYYDEPIEITDSKSEDLINQMLKYNLIRK